MQHDPSKDKPLASEEDLFLPLTSACKPEAQWRIGSEGEKIGLHLDGSPLPYEGDHGVAFLLKTLAQKYDWQPDAEYDGGPQIALTRGRASITLEPGAQFELSGAPQLTMHETAVEFTQHMAELRAPLAQINATFLNLGFHPFAKREDLSWVPKLRYGVMKKYLPTRGAYALDMMLRTATVQANFDFSSEQDAMRKLRVSLALSPIITAMFANSPVVEGKLTGERSHRARVWLDVDNSRAGLLPFAWSKNATFRDYIEWALDVPMFLVKRDSRLVHNTGQTFRAFMKDGFEGERATHADWETHLNTLFPEVRLKRTLEVRGADAQPSELLPALPTLWTGILYDAQAMDAAEALIEGIRYEDAVALRQVLPEQALSATLNGKRLSAWAEAIIDISRAGLARRKYLRADGKDESVYLEPLAALVSRGQSPADALLEKLNADKPLLPQLIEHASL